MVVPVIPLIAILLMAAGGAIMTWYTSLSEKKRKEADDFVMSYLFKNYKINDLKSASPTQVKEATEAARLHLEGKAKTKSRPKI